MRKNKKDYKKVSRVKILNVSGNKMIRKNVLNNNEAGEKGHH